MKPAVLVGVNCGALLALLQSLCLFLASFFADGPGGCCGVIALVGSVAGLAYVTGYATARRTGHPSTGLQAGVICTALAAILSLASCAGLSAVLTVAAGPPRVLVLSDTVARLAFAGVVCGNLIGLDLGLGALGGWLGGIYGAAAYSPDES
jgi:hypothetical protein